jgi:hypothetical protein
MNHPSGNNSSDDRNTRSEYSAGGTGYTDIESIASMKEAMALEGLLIQIGQDSCTEPLRYLERTRAWQQGE